MHLFSGSAVGARRNLRGVISPQRPEMYILGNNRELFFGAGVETTWWHFTRRARDA